MGRATIIPDKDALLLPYQRRWVQDMSRIKIMEKSRQIGISWASAYALVRRKVLTGAAFDAWVSSRDEIQAKLFLDDCKHFAELLKVVSEDLGIQVLDEKGSTSYVLRFANGVKINSMSSSPDAQAGKRGDRLLDEFALHKDNRKLYAIAYPGITWGGQLEMVSTHRGSHNFFNQLIVEAREKGNPKKISLHRVTLEDALNDGFLYRLQEKLSPDDERQEMDETDYFNFIKGGCADEESFLQEQGKAIELRSYSFGDELSVEALITAGITAPKAGMKVTIADGDYKGDYLCTSANKTRSNTDYTKVSITLTRKDSASIVPSRTAGAV